MRHAHDDHTRTETFMREGETLATAFIDRMRQIEATPEEGCAILSTFLAQMASSITGGTVREAVPLMASMVELAGQLLPEFCRLWHLEHDTPEAGGRATP